MSEDAAAAHEQEVQYMMAEAKGCSTRACIEYRIQHRNATLKKLELERDLAAVRLKYDMLFNQVATQGAAATARAAEMGEEAFRLPNGELMTAEKFMERTQILTQTRASLEKSDVKFRKLNEEYAQLHKEKELAVNESKRFEILLSQFERSRRYEVFTSEMHRETVEQNSLLVDENERLQREMSVLRDEIFVLKQQQNKRSDFDHYSSGGTAPVSSSKTTSAFLGPDGKVPGACPLGGCSHYETVLRGHDVMKNFQNHMNNTHRCKTCKCFVVAPKSKHEATCTTESSGKRKLASVRRDVVFPLRGCYII